MRQAQARGRYGGEVPQAVDGLTRVVYISYMTSDENKVVSEAMKVLQGRRKVRRGGRAAGYVASAATREKMTKSQLARWEVKRNQVVVSDKAGDKNNPIISIDNSSE